MVNFILVPILGLLLATSVASANNIYSNVIVGEKPLEGYAGRYDPFVKFNSESGQLSFQDEDDSRSFFVPYSFSDEKTFQHFFKDEMPSALLCSNDQLAKHFDDLRFSYRLIALSYLMEAQWHMKLTASKLNLKDSCDFDLSKWIKTCEPQSSEMKKLVERLQSHNPQYEEALPRHYDLSVWNRELKANLPIWYSQVKLKNECLNGCSSEELSKNFKKVCEQNESLMTLICHEKDEAYGLVKERDAFYLLSRSNIINTYNKDGEALGCLRRFSEVMGHREVRYSALKDLFPVLESFLIDKYQERFMQGRIFFFGAAKEFEQKGLADVFTAKKEVAPTPALVLSKNVPEKKIETPAIVAKSPEPSRQVIAVQTPKKEVDLTKLQSAFLQAAEIREAQNLDRVEVDMGKLRYDYVFSLNMINRLSEKLKLFTTREALKEMQTFDQLGSREGAVPLLFLKFLIDYQEHRGLWNIIATLGQQFYVTNDIDASAKPRTELVQLVNDESSGRQWQLFILKP